MPNPNQPNSESLIESWPTYDQVVSALQLEPREKDTLESALPSYTDCFVVASKFHRLVAQMLDPLGQQETTPFDAISQEVLKVRFGESALKYDYSEADMICASRYQAAVMGDMQPLQLFLSELSAHRKTQWRVIAYTIACWPQHDQIADALVTATYKSPPPRLGRPK